MTDGDGTAAEHAAGGAEQETAGDPFGLQEAAGLAGLGGWLLGQHWVPLLALGLAGSIAHLLLAELAVVAGGVGAVPGFLALALVPLASLAVLVGMLLVLRSRSAGRSDWAGVLAAAGSVLIPFLVVYESRGDLRADLVEYANSGVQRDILADVTSERLPQIGSWLVLGIVVTALVVRSVGTRLVDRSDRWREADDPRRGVLRVVVGYAEAVWVTLGAWVLAGVIANLGDWWSTRNVGQGLVRSWDGVRESLPTLGALGDWVAAAVPVVADAAVTGLVVPLSMLTIAVIVYGIQVADEVSAQDVLAVVERRRWGALASRVGAGPLTQAWQRLSEPGGRFGGLVGGAALVLRSGFAPILAYCVLFTLLQQVDVALWWAARLLLGPSEESVWIAWYDPINQASEILALMLTVALTAVFADRLLTRFGAEGQLNERPRRALRRQPSRNSTNEAAGKSGASTRTATGSASSGSSTSNDSELGTGSSDGSDVPHVSDET